MAHKKKYGQSMRDRMHEHEGMEHHKRHMRAEHKGAPHSKGDVGFVVGHDPMIGRGEHSNLPQEVMMKEYPPMRQARGPMLDDSMVGVDDVMHHAEGQSERYLSHQK